MPESLSTQYPPPVPGLEFLAIFTVELGPPQELGETGLARRRIIPISGGRFAGPGFNGRVLPGGADWQLIQKDGMAIIDTRYGLQTDDGALIYISTRGLRYGPPEVIAAVARGEIVDPQKYYFRVNIQFETGAREYLWLHRALAIGAGMRLADSVLFNAYKVT
jgi:hypothetical protein